MSGEQLCPACSKGMNEHSFGSAAASGRSTIPAPRAAAGPLQRPFSPGEDPPLLARPPGPPGPEAGRPPLREHPGQPGSRARAAAGLPSRRCGGGSPPGPALQLLAASRFPTVPRRSSSQPRACQPNCLLAVGAGTRDQRTSLLPAKIAIAQGGTSGSCARRSVLAASCCSSRLW